MNNTNSFQSTSDLITAKTPAQIPNRQISSNPPLTLNHDLPLPRPLTSPNTFILNQPLNLVSNIKALGINSNSISTNSSNNNATSISLPPINKIYPSTHHHLPTLNPNYATKPPSPHQLLLQQQQQLPPPPAYIFSPYSQSIQIQQQYNQQQQTFPPQANQYQSIQNYTHQPPLTQTYSISSNEQKQTHQNQDQHMFQTHHTQQSGFQFQTRKQHNLNQKPQKEQSASNSSSLLNTTRSAPISPKVKDIIPKDMKIAKGKTLDCGKVEKPKVKISSPKVKKETVTKTTTKLINLVEKLQELINPNETFNKFLNFVNENMTHINQLSNRLKEGVSKTDFSHDPHLKELYYAIVNFSKEELEKLQDINNKYIELFSSWKTIEAKPFFSSQLNDHKKITKSLPVDELLDESQNYPVVPGESVSLKVIPLKPAENQSSLEFNSQGTLQPDLSISIKLVCQHCGSTSTPEWRKGPDDAKILCNACGLFHTKLVKKFNPELARLELKRRRENGESKNRRI